MKKKTENKIKICFLFHFKYKYFISFFVLYAFCIFVHNIYI